MAPVPRDACVAPVAPQGSAGLRTAPPVVVVQSPGGSSASSSVP